MGVVSTGILVLDELTGIAGFPTGTVVHLYGEPGAGKTSVALHVVAQAQARGAKAVWVDADHALDLRMADNHGVDTSELDIARPKSGEDALEQVAHNLRTIAPMVLIIDSAAQLLPVEPSSNAPDPVEPLLRAGLRSLVPLIANANTLLLCTNQTYVPEQSMFSNATHVFGGQTLHHLAALDIRLSKIGLIKREDATIGHRIQARLVKSRVGPAGGRAEFDLLFGTGNNRGGDAFDCASRLGLVELTNHQWCLDGQPLGDQRRVAIDTLNHNPELLDTLTSKVQALLETRFPPPKEH